MTRAEALLDEARHHIKMADILVARAYKEREGNDWELEEHKQTIKDLAHAEIFEIELKLIGILHK